MSKSQITDKNTYKKSTSNRINFETFETSKLVEKSVKTNAVGGKSIAINYMYNKELENLVVQTPRMLTFGIDSYNQNTNFPNYSITFSFIGMEKDEKVQKFYSFLEKLDTWGKELAIKNSWEWLGFKNVSIDTIKTNYYDTIKIHLDKSGKINYSCRFKIKKLGSGYTTAFYTKDKVLIENENVTSICNKGSYARALLECNGFWISSGKLGISWKVKQIVVEPRIDLSREYAFTD